MRPTLGSGLAPHPTLSLVVILALALAQALTPTLTPTLTLTQVKAEGREGETELVVMSFEISVLLARSLVITPPLPSYHPRSS